MTDTDLITAPDDAAVSSTAGASTRGGRTGLAAMVLPELRALATELGIKGISGMRKGDLIAAIKERQGGGGSAAPTTSNAPKTSSEGQLTIGDTDERPADTAKNNGESGRGRRRTRAEAADDAGSAPATGSTATEAPGKDDRQADDSTDGDQRTRNRGRNQNRGDSNQTRGDSNQTRGESNQNRGEGNQTRGDGNQTRGDGNQTRGEGNQNRGDGNQNRDNRDRPQRGNQNSQNNQGQRGNQNNTHDDDDEDGRGRRGRRFRERRRGRDRETPGGQNEPQVADDDVLQPVAGILDVLDNYAFVRTSGYLAGPNDVYVSMNMVRKNGLRRGDAITGAVKVPREGEQPNQRQKFNPLVRLDTVNGTDIETARKRPEFNKLTPLYPNQRLRLETTPERLTTRVIDLIMPIGKGQRALIVSPPKAGKTTIMQDIANAITTNNPECHLMVVLVDERPEEVTDMQRSVKGEVIASTFDRPPSDHTSVAELAIERAKRLVENGKDVVVLLDSITRLGRAYNNASPASGRILSGGVDSTALYPPKRFLGAARNIENGGSLTIIASALVETGSTGDTVIFEEFKGTGNAELKLDRKIAERRVFPAVDVNPSNTRKDELLMSPEEFSIVHKLRRVLSGLDSQQAIDLLVSQLKKTPNNVQFLMQVQKNAPGVMNDD
ncbi:transcription termination factor Rho [Gordonia sp. CPCC 205515]|uniref:transcription termination factor Rho n=1 Tax=Gordonia sp. CPCC 205515 TaxID=3140791 RepID=UPI003AF3A5AA